VRLKEPSQWHKETYDIHEALDLTMRTSPYETGGAVETIANELNLLRDVVTALVVKLYDEQYLSDDDLVDVVSSGSHNFAIVED